MKLVIKCDASRSNPNRVGFIIFNKENKEDYNHIYERSKEIRGDFTSVELECLAIVHSLVQAKPISSYETTVLTDCKSIINNISTYKDNRICNNTNINERFFNLAENFNNLSIEWIPREKNIDADELVSVN